VAKIAIPNKPAELEELFSDKAKVDNLFAEGQFVEVVAAYVKAVGEKDPEIERQTLEQTQQVLAKLFKDMGVTGERPNLSPSAPVQRAGYRPNPKAVGAPLNGLFGSSAECFQAVWAVSHRHGSPTVEQTAKMDKIRNYQEKVPSEGGFLVPEEWRAELFALALEASIVRSRARVVPMGSPTLHFPAIDDTSHATSVMGGIIVYRTEEGAELTESAASFGTVKLEATKQTALAHVTNELIRDVAGGFDAFVESSFPSAMSYFEDVDFLTANGAGAPLGALSVNNPAIVVIDKETNQVTATIYWENIIKMYARMLPQSLNTAVWIASPDTFAQLATMALSVGTGGSAIWLVNGQNQPVLTLLGRPVIMTEKAPGVLGTQGDLSFVDLSMYLIGDRQTVTIDASPHVKFTSDRTTFRVIARNDGRPWVQSPITPRNGGPTLSPYVQLQTR
jgi:HK97 family phage major capsid protein